MNHKSRHKFLKNTSLLDGLGFTVSANHQTKIVDILSIYKKLLNMLCWYMTIIQPSRNMFTVIKLITGGFHKINQISKMRGRAKTKNHLLWA